MSPKEYFKSPEKTLQRHYDGLRAYYHEGKSEADVAAMLDWTPQYFKKMRGEFVSTLKKGEDPFFAHKKKGPKGRRTPENLIEKVVLLRKRNYAIGDIRVALQAEGLNLSIASIDKTLKEQGFAPLPKRTREERLTVQAPAALPAPRVSALDLKTEVFSTELGAGPLIFLPLIEELGLIQIIEQCGFPETKDVSAVHYILSFLALKLISNKRWSHDSLWGFDRALGLFAGLNVLPKATSLSTYSYRVQRQSNLNLLRQLSRVFESNSDGEFNLDFKAIPHWGGASVLEKNWCGTRKCAMKSVLALIVQNPESGMISYTDSEIKHSNQNDAVLEFVDFWTDAHNAPPKMLIFDSKMTSYENLNKLNQDKIFFLTLRRRGKKLIDQIAKIPEEEWKKVRLDRSHGKQQTVRIHERNIKLRHYEGELREIIMTDHGREKPVFLITNDLEANAKTFIKKYARRWLVEQEIAEQVAFFHINQPSSSIVVKVDFDLTLSLLAHNLYRMLASHLPGFEHCNAETLCRNFLMNGAKIITTPTAVRVELKKKSHLPILFEVPWMKKTTHLGGLNIDITFAGGTVS